MKFSFDFENYRDNLAKELKKKRMESKEDAKQILANEQNTEQYRIANDAKIASQEKANFDFEKYRQDLARKLREKGQTSRSESKEMQQQERQTPKYNLARILKADVLNDKKRHKKTQERIDQKFEVYDISDKIPDIIKLFLDKVKLKEIGKEQSFDIKFEIQEVRQIGMDFMNELTNGDFYSPKMFNHVRSAASNLMSFTRLMTSEKKIGDVLINKQNNKRLLFGDCSNSDIWFAAGGASYFYDPRKFVMIVDPHSEKFKKSIKAIDDTIAVRYNIPRKYKGPIEITEIKSEDLDSVLDICLEVANEAKVDGVYFTFKYGTMWSDIIDWAIDLPNGKLYEAKDKITSPEKSQENQ